MDQHKLYRTIRVLSDEKVRTEEQLLGHILENIIVNEAIPIRGGRIWKLEQNSGSYRLLRQYGEIEESNAAFVESCARHSFRRGLNLGQAIGLVYDVLMDRVDG